MDTLYGIPFSVQLCGKRIKLMRVPNSHKLYLIFDHNFLTLLIIKHYVHCELRSDSCIFISVARDIFLHSRVIRAI